MFVNDESGSIGHAEYNDTLSFIGNLIKEYRYIIWRSQFTLFSARDAAIILSYDVIVSYSLRGEDNE